LNSAKFIKPVEPKTQQLTKTQQLPKTLLLLKTPPLNEMILAESHNQIFGLEKDNSRVTATNLFHPFLYLC